MSVKLRVLAAFFLVPLIVFANPATAQAATGGQVLRFNMDRLGPDIQCEAEVTYGALTTDAAKIRLGVGWCTMRTVDSPFNGCEVLDAECTTFQFDIPGCRTAIVPDQPQGESEWYRTTTLFGPMDFDVGAACNPTQVCLYIKSEIDGASDLEESQCIDVDFSDGVSEDPGTDYPPPAELDQCAWGDPQGVTAREVDMGFGLVKDQVRLTMYSRWPDGTQGDHWNLSLAHGPVSTGPAKELQNTASQGVWSSPTFWEYDPIGTGLGGSHNPNPPIWGIQVTSNMQNVTGDQFGYTDPERCTFYFGPKIRTEDHPIYGESDPWGPVTEFDAPPPPPPEEVPEPPVTEVPTGEVDPNAGWFGALLDALWDLVKGILNGIKNLFIPTEGFMDAEFSDLKDEWEDTSPMKFVNVFDGLSTGTVSGCGGLPLNVDLGGGVVIDERIGAACSGSMAGVASLVRAALTAVVFVGGAIACLRGVGAGFGWRPSIGRRGDDS